MLATLLFAAAMQTAPCTSDVVITNAVSATAPLSETAQVGSGRVTTVQVTVDANGRVTKEKVDTSSGLTGVDQAALMAAAQSTYQPARQNCQPVAQTVDVDEVVRPDWTQMIELCRTPYQDVAIIKQAMPQYPDIARQIRAGGRAEVDLTIGANGDVLKAAIAQSTGNMSLDQSALDAARTSIYAPKIVHCVPTTGSYHFVVTFNP
jgi:TonB family protein